MNQINNLFVKGYFPVLLKYISLVAYVILIITGLAAYSTDAAFLIQLRNTNLGNLIVWSYWWPAIVIGAIFFGRIWCMVCPVEVITTFFAKIGLKQKRPRWLLSGWSITIFYILILFIGIQGFAIHRNPFSMAIYLLTIVGVSILIGSIYEKNTFCRYVCPVGYLLGLYSKLSFFGWRVKNKNVCDICQDKSCIHKKYRYNLNYKSCGVDLYPAKIEDNSNCILCAGCLKTCSKYQSEPNANRPNPQLKYIGFASDLFNLKPLKVAEMVFVMVVSGFVFSEILSEWTVTDMYTLIPGFLTDYLFIRNSILLVLSTNLILFVIFPLIIWSLPYLILMLTGIKIKLKDYLVTYGIAFIPIIAAAHLDKAILKTTSRLPYFEHLFSDVIGISTAQQIIDDNIKLNENPVWLNIMVTVLLTIVMVAGIWMSVKVVKRLNAIGSTTAVGNSFYLIPLIYGSIFLLMIIRWRWF